MLKKTKRNTVIIGLTLLLCVSFGITLAAFKSQSNTLTNTFDVGSVETEIKEDVPKPNGSDIDKAPYVKNTGKNEALIRMRFTMTPSELVEALNIQLEFNSQYWIYNDADGFYYYKDIVEPNAVTQPLFTKVKGNGIVENGEFSDKLEGLEIAVYHESVQANIKHGDETINASTGLLSDENTSRIWQIFDQLDD